MRLARVPLFGLVVAASLFAVSASGISLQISPNSTQSSNPVEADYSSTHLFVDEINGDSIPIYVFFNPDPQTSGTVDEAEVFTNLNNRDQANVLSGGSNVPDVTGSAGIPYGIVPPNGAYIVAGATNCYYTAYPMSATNGGFQTVVYANKTGAYRLTARYHLTSDPPLTSTGPNTWHYYDDFSDGSVNADGSINNYRDAAIVVSPTKARQMVMYELNVLNIDAENPANDTDYTQRSTFDDLYGGPDATTQRPFNLNYIKGLGVNWLWLQPIHPIGIQGRQTDPNESNQPFSVGSPYAVKNYFAVNSLYWKYFVPGQTDETTGRANAMKEFQGFMKAANTAGVNVMLDVPFNHTAFDCELDGTGQGLFGNATTSGTSLMENVEARIYSRWDGEGISGASQTAMDSTDLSYFHFDQRAYDAGSISLAADRFDFAKFVDVHNNYFGRYSALVDQDVSADEEQYLNQGDWFDYSVGGEGSEGSGNGHFDSVTQNVWKYYAWYIPYWLQQTGHTDSYGNLVGNSTLSDPVARRAADDLGIGGIRADFAQGLPPQCWEYIMNTARSYKWDLVFLAESLDGGNVTYRSSRHFDVVNDNVLFDLYNDQATSDFRSTYDARRTSYGQGLVIWDTESHDEAGYNDPYQALIRYAADSTIDGVPDIFYGQEIGIAGAVVPPNSNNFVSPYGFANYQVNDNKPIPNFMCFNSLANAWNDLGSNAYGQAQLYPVYAAIGQARLSSPALQSSNRYYLNDNGGNTPANIYAVAKYATANAHPNLSDVVFAFVNLAKSASQTDTFNVNITQNGTNLFGIDPNRTYNIKNIAADTEYDSTRANVWLWGTAGITGSNILNNGIYVSLNSVPGNTAGWQSSPYEAQYLKLYDITPPPAPGVPSTAKAYAIGSSATFTWTAATDAEGGIEGYQVLVSTAPNGGGTVIFSGTTPTNSITVTGTYGQTLYATITSLNNAGIDSATSSVSAAGTILLDPNGDQNGTGLTNAQQDAAGFSPLSNFYFHITSIVPTSGNITLSWASVPGRTYQVQSRPDLVSSYVALSGTITATQNSTSYTDTSAGSAPRFYRVTTPTQ